MTRFTPNASGGFKRNSEDQMNQHKMFMESVRHVAKAVAAMTSAQKWRAIILERRNAIYRNGSHRGQAYVEKAR